MRPPRTLAAGLTTLMLSAGLLATGCGPVAQAPAAAGVPRAEALAQLDALPLGEWASMSGYSRDRFEHWSSQGGGCDTRDVVLKRDGTAVAASGECKITQGTWFSVYDGETFTDPRNVDIDHMVPLANAWRTGAKDWTDEQREQFANDLTRPQLHAVGSSVNRSKGDQDPSQWRPPLSAYWCVYAQDWVSVKAHWHLSITAAEKPALAEMLASCP